MSTFESIGDKFVFRDSLEVAAPAEVAFDLLWRADAWPEILPHVLGLRMMDDKPDYQRFEMETQGAAGIHVTESVRECTPNREVRYRQVKPPAMLVEHSGRWFLEQRSTGVKITSEHTIEIRQAAIESALGRPYSVEEAALLSRHMIGNHSVATLKVVKRRAESAEPRSTSLPVLEERAS